jgi:hypothetical protein
VKRIGLAVFAVVFCLLCVAGAQDSPPEATSNGPGAQLRADLIKAVQNGHLTDAQKRKSA